MVVTFSSCQKEKETIVVITIKDTSGNVVPGATVKLFPDYTPSSVTGFYPSESLTKIEVTDTQGRVQFTYELEAILNINVSKVNGNDTLNGVSVVRLLKEKTVTKTVEVN